MDILFNISQYIQFLIHFFLSPVVKPITESYLISNYHQEKALLRIPATLEKRNENYQCQKIK